MRRFAFIAVPVLAALITLVACGGEPTPAAPTPTPTPPPAPAPAPTPTPTPGYNCPLPASENPNNNCEKGVARLTEVNLAIDALLTKHPELFNFSDLSGGNPKVVNITRYYQEIQEELGNFGICTKITPEEISVKISNDYSEDWIVLTSGNYVRRRYQGTCTPAWW